MNKAEIKHLLPILQAFVDGKEIQYYNGMKWIDAPKDNCSFSFPSMYRIKPEEPKYRPFKNMEECWNEMLKHQPFGWAYCVRKGSKFLIREITNAKTRNYPVTQIDLNGTPTTFQSAFYQIRFVDGSQFGVIKED